ncbi:hypothetical protein KDA23_05340 [Candidatus Saccharibacteria bacterium]|nr:hypothetical protein [Candidatus Saccharibacteria bacterium]
MYRLGRTTHHSHKIAATILFLTICGVVVGAVWLFQQLQTETTISQAEPQTTSVTVPTAQTQTVKGDHFTVKIPKGWKPEKENVSFNVFAWRGASKEAATRLIEIYVDNIPLTKSFNMLLPVKANGNGLLLAGDVSENCVNFTDKKNLNPRTGAAPAKWSGIDFYCDMSNAARNVLATGSSDGINFVRLTNVKGTKHRYLLVYTDHSAGPDNTIFTDAIASFKAT